MCGISFTYCNSKYNKKTKVDINQLYFKVLNSIKKKRLNTKYIFENSIKYKTDSNFLTFFRSKHERMNVKKLIRLLKKNIYKNNNLLSDSIWFFEEELNNRYEFVKKFLNKKHYYSDSVIIFYRTLNSILNSINIQEIRGRDSMGLFLNIYLNKDYLDQKTLIQLKNENLITNENSKHLIVSFIFKTFNIFGSLKDNSKNILNEIKKNKKLKKTIFSKAYEKAAFMAHTRWASSGVVNVQNTHPADNMLEKRKDSPLIYTIMNGDINNYQSIFKQLKNQRKIITKKNINDTKLLSCFLGSDNYFFNNEKLKKKIKILKGSFTSINTCSNDMSKFLITKKGKQGIYLGINPDRIFLSSDIYGLVEDCELHSSLQSDSYLYFDINKTKKINFQSFDNKKLKKQLIFKKTNITSQDVSKKNFDHYMKKEIYEAKDVIDKTIDNYTKKNIKNSFFKDCNFVDKIKKGKITKIYITGMGTCYTAGLSISNYMQKHFLKNDIPIEILPIIAAEGSVIKIEQDMSNVLLIVIAQSGTTKDTNVFADIAKRRGASTISFLNKRGGDISFLVDKTFYIGDGRDIEMSVPSTKTYFAHIILGQIFTLLLINKIQNKSKLNFIEFSKIKKTSKLISHTIKNFKRLNFKSFLNSFSKNKQWFVLFDNKETQFISEETRIKMSECCYKTVSNVHVDDFLNLKIENSCILLNVSSIKKNYYKIITLAKRNNTIIIISPNNYSFNKYGLKNIINIEAENKGNEFLSFTYVILTQLISYSLAKFLDNKKNFFLKIKKEILKKEKNKKNIKSFLKQNKEKYFLISVQDNEIEKLDRLLKKYISNNLLYDKDCINQIDLLINFISRPIDTIKHQAKTITVGTERVNTLKKLSITRKKSFKLKKIRNKEKIFIFQNNISELIKNYIFEVINNYSKLSKKNIDVKFEELNKYKKFTENNMYSIFVNNDYRNFADFTVYSLTKKMNFKNFESDFKFKNTNQYLKNFLKIDLSIFSILDEMFGLNIFKNYTAKLKKDFNLIKNFTDKYKLQEISKNNKKIKNFKVLSSPQNKNSSKILSLLIGKHLGTTCSFDLLENHKHIDISSEPFLIVIVTDIKNSDYKHDALSEFQKFRSHNNKLLIITDEKDNTYDNELNKLEIIKLPKIKNKFTLLMILRLFDKYLN